MDDYVEKILNEIGIQYAKDDFETEEVVETPYLIYYYGKTKTIPNDGLDIKIHSLVFALYTDKKSVEDELKIEDVLSANGIRFKKEEEDLTKERMYIVVYSMEV